MANSKLRNSVEDGQRRGESSSSTRYQIPNSNHNYPDNATQDQYGLKMLSPGENPVVDIIAVHGFNGHREYTWTAGNGVLWLRDLLPNEVPQARVLSFGYDTGNRQVFDVGESLVSELSLERRKNKIDNKRPIIFIVHSLGGIIVKSALIYAESTHSSHLSHHKEIKLSTYGILFFGTPHQGGESLLVDLDSAFNHTNKTVRRDLTRHSAWIQQQLSQYLPISGGFKTIFFYETSPTITSSGKSILMVPKPSAVVAGAIDAETVDIGKDHITMVKYSFAQEYTFKKVSEHISLMVEGAPGRILENWKQLGAPDDPERAKILQWLSTIEYRDNHLDASEGRLEGSGEWLLRKNEFCEWQQSKKSTILWLHGIPGAGKTKLTSMIVDDLLKKTSSSNEALAYFYCKRNAAGPSDPDVIMRTIVKQLSYLRDGPLQDPVLNVYETRKKDGFSSGLLRFEESLDLINSLINIYPQTTIIIDALDECDADKRARLLRALTEIMDSSIKPVKIFVSSRDDGDIVLRLKNSPNLYIEASDNIEDIERFVHSEVTSCIKEKRLLRGRVADNLRESMIHSLINGSHGMFLWVSLQIEQFCAMVLESDVRRRLGKLPKTLRETYSEIYRRILLQGSGLGVAQKAIMWVMCSRRPLQPGELAFMVSSQESEESGVACELSINALFHVCCNLLTHDRQSNVVQFAHLSVREFLEQMNNTHSVNYPFNTHDMNRMAAKFCLSRLSNPEFWPPGLGSATTEYSASTSVASPGARIAKYTIRYWATHVQLCSDKKEDTRILSSIVRFYGSLCVPSKEYVQWVESATNDDDYYFRQSVKEISKPIVPLLASCVFGFGETLIDMYGLDNLNTEIRQRALYLASEKGHHRIVGALLRNGVDNKAQGGYHGYALQAAASRGHRKVVELLLQDGADVNAQDGQHGYALQSAASRGHKEVVELLLEKGADVNAQDGQHGYALQSAASRGHGEVVKLLLEKGADVNAQGGQHGYALQSAASRGHEEVVKLLLEKGADVNAQDGQHGYALQSAASRGHKKVVELLLQKGADVNAQDGQHGYALQSAAADGHGGVAELLLQYGADLNAQGGLHGSALRAAATNKHWGVTKLILQNTPGVKIDVDGENILFTFIKARSKTVDMLLENGAKIAATDKDGNTTIILAARSEHEKVTEMIQADIRATDGDGYTQHTKARGGSEPDFEDNRSILSDSDSNYTGASLFSGYSGPSSNTSVPPVPQSVLKTVEDSIVGVLASSSAVSTVLSEAVKKQSQTTVNRRLCRALAEFSKTVRGLQTTKRLSQAELTVLRNLTGKNTLDTVAFKIGSIFMPKSNHLKLNNLQNCGQLQKQEIVDSYLQSGSSDASEKLSEVERPDDMKDPVDSDDSDDPNDSESSNDEEEFLGSVEPDWPTEQILDYFKSKEILGIFEGAVVKRFTRVRHSPKTLQETNRQDKENTPATKKTLEGVEVVDRYSWPAKFAKGKTNIRFEIGYRWGLSNHLKGWMEDFVRQPVNWWPLEP